MTTRKKNEKKYFVVDEYTLSHSQTLNDAKEEALKNCENSGEKHYIITVEYSCVPTKPSLKAGYVK